MAIPIMAALAAGTSIVAPGVIGSLAGVGLIGGLAGVIAHQIAKEAKKKDDKEELVTAKQAAEAMGVSENAVKDKIRKGKLEASDVKLDKKLLISYDEVLKYAKENGIEIKLSEEELEAKKELEDLANDETKLKAYIRDKKREVEKLNLEIENLQLDLDEIELFSSDKEDIEVRKKKLVLRRKINEKKIQKIDLEGYIATLESWGK